MPTLEKLYFKLHTFAATIPVAYFYDSIISYGAGMHWHTTQKVKTEFLPEVPP